MNIDKLRDKCRASIAPHGTRWSYTVRIDGKKVRQSFDTFEAALEARLDHELAKQHKGQQGRPRKLLSGAIASYMNTITNPESVRRFKQIADNVVRFFGANMDIHRITTPDVIAYKAARRDEVKKRLGREMKNNGLRTELTFLRRVLDRAKVRDNPVSLDIIPRKEQKKPKPLAEADLNRFLQLCPNLRFRYLVQIVHHTAMRRREVNNIRVSDFNFEVEDAPTFTVRREYLKGELEKGGDDVRGMTLEAKRIVQEYIELLGLSGEEKLFGYAEANYITKLYRQARIQYGLPPEFYCHGGRHTCITNIMRTGKLNDALTKMMSGHRSTDSLRIYDGVEAVDASRLFNAKESA